MATVRLTETSLVVEDLDCSDPEVVEFFTDTAEAARGELACRALTMGVVGLRAMGITGHVELVEREFLKLSQRFDAALRTVEENLFERVNATFDPDKAESVSGRLTDSISGAHRTASQVIEQARGDLEKLIGDSFNPDLATSCVYRIGKLVADTHAELDRAFDSGAPDAG